MRSARLASLLLAGALALGTGAAQAEEAAGTPLTICYGYGCQVEAKIRFDEAIFGTVAEILATADDARTERYAISAAVARMYVEAGKHTPIWRDRGGDHNDDGVVGMMDCIDHAANTTTFLKLMEDHGLLRFHQVGSILGRGWVAQHFAAQIVEKESNAPYAVDSWYYDFGMPAIVMAAREWRGGQRPPGIMAGFR